MYDMWVPFNIRHAAWKVCEIVNGEIEKLSKGKVVAWRVVGGPRVNPRWGDAEELSALALVAFLEQFQYKPNGTFPNPSQTKRCKRLLFIECCRFIFDYVCIPFAPADSTLPLSAKVLTDGKELECNVIMTHDRITIPMASQHDGYMIYGYPKPQATYSTPNSERDRYLKSHHPGLWLYRRDTSFWKVYSCSFMTY